MLYEDLKRFMQWHSLSLNPCFNGICSMREKSGYGESRSVWVLILVLMEYALWDLLDPLSLNYIPVLILVLMEYALWEILLRTPLCWTMGLNPCFNGICSMSIVRHVDAHGTTIVLILVLMEYALWARVWTPLWCISQS